MTATAELIAVDSATRASVRVAHGGRMMVRATQRLAGTALAIAAIGLWISPGAAWDADILLFKLVLSAAAGLAGAALMLAGRTPQMPEMEIDTIRREIRLVRRGHGGTAVVLQRSAFKDLSRAEQKGAHLRLWDQAGDFLAEVSLPDRATMNSLLAGLRDAGKIA